MATTPTPDPIIPAIQTETAPGISAQPDTPPPTVDEHIAETFAPLNESPS